MAVKKQVGKQKRRTRTDAKPVVEEREIARRNQKPRSSRESLKGVTDRKGKGKR